MLLEDAAKIILNYDVANYGLAIFAWQRWPYTGGQRAGGRCGIIGLTHPFARQVDEHAVYGEVELEFRVGLDCTIGEICLTEEELATMLDLVGARETAELVGARLIHLVENWAPHEIEHARQWAQMDH
jgi:hypothetical protein